jgi:predicted ester cyclase
MIWSAFPDWRYSIEDLIAGGDKVVARVTVYGTHQGNFLGIPATGTPVTMTEIQIVRVAFGQIVDMWANVDLLGMLQQLGAVPAPGQAS